MLMCIGVGYVVGGCKYNVLAIHGGYGPVCKNCGAMSMQCRCQRSE